MSRAPDASTTLSVASYPWWVRLGWLFLTLAVMAVAISFVGTIRFEGGDRASFFVAWFSLGVTAVAGYLAIRIFRKQTDEAEISRNEQQELLKKIVESSSNAAVYARASRDNTVDIIQSLNEAKLRKMQESLSTERQEQVRVAYESASVAGARVLWVDDDAESIEFEKKTLELAGIMITWVRNTEVALEVLRGNDFSLVISDMGRPEGKRAGYELLNAMRFRGMNNPFIIYSGSRSPQHVNEAYTHGAQGATNDPAELFELVLRGIS